MMKLRLENRILLQEDRNKNNADHNKNGNSQNDAKECAATLACGPLVSSGFLFHAREQRRTYTEMNDTLFRVLSSSCGVSFNHIYTINHELHQHTDVFSLLRDHLAEISHHGIQLLRGNSNLSDVLMSFLDHDLI